MTWTVWCRVRPPGSRKRCPRNWRQSEHRAKKRGMRSQAESGVYVDGPPSDLTIRFFAAYTSKDFLHTTPIVTLACHYPTGTGLQMGKRKTLLVTLAMAGLYFVSVGGIHALVLGKEPIFEMLVAPLVQGNGLDTTLAMVCLLLLAWAPFRGETEAHTFNSWFNLRFQRASHSGRVLALPAREDRGDGRRIQRRDCPL